MADLVASLKEKAKKIPLVKTNKPKNKTTNVDFSIASLNDIELYEEIVDEYILDKKTKEKILENIEFKTTIPIPSFKIKRIEQNDTIKRIEFVYNIRNLSRKLKFSDISQDNPLYVYGHFCNLEVTDHTNKGCVNLKITSKEDFINYCIAQYNEDINIYKNFEKEGKLPLRVTVCIDELFEPEILTKEKLNNPYRKVQLGAYKIFSDGSMGSRSAALKKPYSDDPQNSGFMLFKQKE